MFRGQMLNDSFPGGSTYTVHTTQFLSLYNTIFLPASQPIDKFLPISYFIGITFVLESVGILYLSDIEMCFELCE